MASIVSQSPLPSILILLSSAILLLLPSPSFSSDPDPVQDFCIADLRGRASASGFPCKPTSEVTSDDFFFDGLTREGNTNNTFKSELVRGNVHTFPGLNSQGISMNRVDIAPGGINAPHTHPRATELSIVIKGKLFVGIFTTSNVFYSRNLTAGQMFVVPRGLMHFEMNVGKEKAFMYASFNSQLPGTVDTSLNLFASRPSVPNDVLTVDFQVNESVVDQIKSKFGRNVL